MDGLQLTGEEMRTLGGCIDNTLTGLYGKGKIGFTLLTFQVGNPGISNYLSSGHREDMIAHLRDTADRIEKNQTFPTPEKSED